MLWFDKNKGLATGISIMGFGLAKAIATPVMNILQEKFGVAAMFYILGGIYFIVMFIGHLLLQKPKGWVEPQIEKKQNILSMFKKPEFVGIWLMFFLNIHCGLMIISYEKQILNLVFAGSIALATIVSVVPSCTAISNALGRIGYSTISDKCKQRNTIYKIIFISSIVVSIAMFAFGFNNMTTLIFGILTIIYLLVVNAGYGGGFSTLPALLSERFGMTKISQIHGLALSAWAVAGLTGNNTSEIILNTTGNYQVVFAVAAGLYITALLICIFLVKNKKEVIN
jgi:OFA family oxalate/formate antiporter-like MFS transporter